jgi:hypothetical protein
VLHVRVGIAAVTTLLVGIGTAGCGAGQSQDNAATGTPTASSQTGHDAGQQPGHSDGSQPGSGHGHKSGGPDGTPGKGTYDDTSGTRAKAPKNQNAVLTQIPGTKTSGCVAVGTRTDVRSGRMAMGNFADARADFAKAKSVYDAASSFFYVIPMSRSVKSVTVTATRVGGGGAPVRVRSTDVEQAAQWNYFPINITLTSVGTWRFRVTSAAGHSCFDAKFAT